MEMCKGPEGEEKEKQLFWELQAVQNSRSRELQAEVMTRGGWVLPRSTTNAEPGSWDLHICMPASAEVRLTRGALWSPVCDSQLLQDRVPTSNLQTQLAAPYTTGAQKRD